MWLKHQLQSLPPARTNGRTWSVELRDRFVARTSSRELRTFVFVDDFPRPPPPFGERTYNSSVASRERSLRRGLLLVACSVLAGLAVWQLDLWLLPQRWSLSDEPLPPWFFGPLGRAWVFGAPLATVALLGAGMVTLVRGLRR